jgi:poly(A) polymerase
MTALQAATKIVNTLRERGHVALLAGGCVRDELLGIEPADYDVATDATPEQIGRIFKRTKAVGAQFGVMLVRLKGVEVEVATFRADGAYHDGRRPEQVTFTTAEVDARRRDFTVNGMFFDPVADEIVDYVGGREDLAAKVIRCIGDPDARFAEDHLRMLRAVRFAARLGFAIESGTSAAIERLAPAIAKISAERIRMELEQILAHPNRAEGWRLITSLGLANHLIAGVAWSPAAAQHVGRVLTAFSGIVSFELAFAALLQPRSSQAINDACRALRCSVAGMRATGYLVTTSARMLSNDDWSLADIKTLMASGYGDDALNLASALRIADECDTSPIDALRARITRIHPDDYAPPPLVTGDDLVALNLPPGPRFREILDELYRQQLNETLTTRDAAMECLHALMQRTANE